MSFDPVSYAMGAKSAGGGGGGGSGVLVVHMQYDAGTQTGTLDKTYSEIVNAGFVVLEGFAFDGAMRCGFVYQTLYDEYLPGYGVYIQSGDANWIGAASSENDYPVFDFS